jgi:hypothetical protein
MTAQKVVRPGAETKHVYAVRARSEGDCYTKDMLTLCVCCMLSGLLARELQLCPSILCAFHTHFNSDKGLILGNPATFLGCTLKLLTAILFYYSNFRAKSWGQTFVNSWM